MRRLRTVSLVVSIATAVLGASITSAHATTTEWTDNPPSAPTSMTVSAEKPPPARGPLVWTDNSQYYSLETNYQALNRCIVVKEFGNIGYQTDYYHDANETLVYRWIQKPKMLSPTTVVQFYDQCGAGRVLQPLPSARVELTTAWTDNHAVLEFWDSLSVSYPWGISFTPTSAGYGNDWAYRSIESNTTTTDQFTFTSTGTMATWTSRDYTEHLIRETPVYPKMTITNELTKFVVHSGDRSHTFGMDALPKKSVTIW